MLVAPSSLGPGRVRARVRVRVRVRAFVSSAFVSGTGTPHSSSLRSTMSDMASRRKWG